jgi:5-methylcytosine-specific restriction protein A
MPTAALRPCAQPNCSALVSHGRCPEHTRAQDRSRRASETWRHTRGASNNTIDIYQSPRWRALRLRVLREATYLCQCEECAARVYPRLPDVADTVDHVRPHRGYMVLFWDRANLQALSHAHHSRKTMREVR